MDHVRAEDAVLLLQIPYINERKKSKLHSTAVEPKQRFAKMRAPLACLLLLQLFLVFSEGEPQFFYGGNPYHQYFQQPYFRNQAFQEGDSFAARVDPEPRFFFSALTLTLTTTTVTRTVTSSTVCTTTTAALSNCLASGGRRRRSSSSPHLYYNDSPLTDNEESMFLPLSQK